MLPMEEWSVDMLREVLLKEGISEEIADRFQEEDIDGSVFGMYREDEFESDFKLKKGPFRKILRIREKYASQKPTAGKSTDPVGGDDGSSQILKQEQDIGVLEAKVSTLQVSSNNQTSGKPTGARPKARKNPVIKTQGDVENVSSRPKRSRGMIDVEKRLRRLLLGNEQLALDESYQPILVANKPSETALSSDQSIVDHLSFVSHVNWKVVFDFYELSNENGLCHYFSDTRKPSLQLPETVDSKIISDLEQVDDPVWMFCNGREDDTNIEQPVLSRQKWNEERSKDVEGVISLIAKQNIIPSSRSVIVFLILSENKIGILSDTFRKFFSEFRGMDNITFIVESTDVYDIWEEEVKRWCNVDELQARSIVGVPLTAINNIMHRMARVNVTSDMTLPSAGQRSVYLGERDIKKWKDISVVCQNECKNTDMDEDHPEFESFIKEKELQFYKGHKPDWWNFELTEGQYNGGNGYNHVLRRTRYDKLQSKITSALQGALSHDLIITITMFHQPGCGASTLARHQLWAFHEEYRCMIVDRVTSSTAKQILDVRKYKLRSDADCMPVLVLVDDLEDSELTELITDLENLSKELIVRGVLCVLLHCKRTPDPESLLKRSDQRLAFILQQELDHHEQSWFQKKYEELEDKEDRLKTGDYTPERLIAFMVMKEECNPKYVKKIVSETLSDVSKKSTKEYKLLKYASVLNSYLGDAAIPVSSCDEFMASSTMLTTRRHTPTTTAIKKNIPWEKTLTPSSQMLLIKVQMTGIGIQGIRIVHRCVAEEILREITDEKDQTLADVVLELLNSDLLRSVSHSKSHLARQMHNLLIRRKKYDLGDSEETQFSPLIEKVYTKDKPKALEILESGCELLSHAQYAQQAARLCYILEKDYSRAHEYARRAINLQPNNPYLLDTEAQIYRSEIKDKYTLKYQHEDKVLPMKESKNLIQLAESAIETFRKSQKILSSQKSSFFSEVDIAFMLIQILDRCTPIFRQAGGKEKLKAYLLTDAVPDGLEEWQSFHPFFKNLKSSIDASMQEMDNFLTFCKDASSQNVMGHELDLKKRQQRKLHNLYVDYFGEPLNAIPPRNADSADWRRRQVSSIGADNFHRIFELARSRDNKENSGKLKKVIELLTQNKPYTYFDLRIMICAILAYSSLAQSEHEHIPSVDEVYEMVTELKDKAAQLQNEIYASFFLLMFLWPHPNDTVHRIKHPQTLKGQMNDLESRWKTQWAGNERDIEEERSLYGKVRHRFGRRKPPTFFFLGEGKSLSRFVHINEFNATPSIIQSEKDQFWEKPRIKERLTPLRGTLYNNTHLSYVTPTKEQLYIRLALPKTEVESQDPVTFYLGFSWRGPVAYNVKPAGGMRSNNRPKTYRKAYPRYLTPKRLSDEELEGRLAQSETKKMEILRHLQKLENLEQKKKKKGVRLTDDQVIYVLFDF